METKWDKQFIGWKEICQHVQLIIEHTCLLDSVDISIGSNTVDCFVTIVSSVAHKSV